MWMMDAELSSGSSSSSGIDDVETLECKCVDYIYIYTFNIEHVFVVQLLNVVLYFLMYTNNHLVHALNEQRTNRTNIYKYVMKIYKNYLVTLLCSRKMSAKHGRFLRRNKSDPTGLSGSVNLSDEFMSKLDFQHTMETAKMVENHIRKSRKNSIANVNDLDIKSSGTSGGGIAAFDKDLINMNHDENENEIIASTMEMEDIRTSLKGGSARNETDDNLYATAGSGSVATSLSVLDHVYTLNTKVDALDSCNYWYSATFVQMDILRQRAVRVQYDGYSAKWNEWIKIDSELYRITTHKTRSMGNGKKKVVFLALWQRNIIEVKKVNN